MRVLFIGEGSTLAHAARPLALAAALPKRRYEVFLAVPERYRQWVPPQVQWLPLQAQTPAEFTDRLQRGLPVFSRTRLEAYYEEDLALFEATRPQVVVGDLRLSLAASARMARVPYATISNAYWSPDQRPEPQLGQGRGPAAEALEGGANGPQRSIGCSSRMASSPWAATCAGPSPRPTSPSMPTCPRCSRS